MSDINANNGDIIEMDQKPAAVPAAPPAVTPVEESDLKPAAEDTSLVVGNNDEESPEPVDMDTMKVPAPAKNNEEEETFGDEGQRQAEPGEAAAVPPPQPTPKGPPPPPPAAVDAVDDMKKPGAVPDTAEPTTKPPPDGEPKETQETMAKKEAGGDVEQGGAANKEGGAGGAPPAPKPKKEGSKREMNPNFKDVQETGSWGGISTVEKVVVGVVALLILIGVIVAVVVVLGKNNEPKEEVVAAVTQAPTPAATPIPPEEKFSLIMEGIQNNPVTALLAETLPEDPSFYKGLAEDEAACAETPSDCAMSWVLYNDEFPPETNNTVVSRYALASLYYSLNGPTWKNNTNWLSSASFCQWYGINCNRVGTQVEELDLGENNLQGELPLELSLIDTIFVISMKENKLSGGLPGDVIASLPVLFGLYLQSNLLAGPIPDNMLNEEESLGVLYIHDNNFTGPYPSVYCEGAEGAAFKQFSLDCSSKNECPLDCCKSENCF